MLKRESLRSDSIKNEKDELENANAEFMRSNADLKRQVDKWQSLGNRDGAEIEKTRKERIALEVKLREVETRLSEREEHLTEELQLKDAKMEKFRARLKDYVVRFILWSRVFLIVRAQCFLSRTLTRNLATSLNSSSRRVRSSNGRWPRSGRRM